MKFFVIILVFGFTTNLLAYEEYPGDGDKGGVNEEQQQRLYDTSCDPCEAAKRNQKRLGSTVGNLTSSSQIEGKEGTR